MKSKYVDCSGLSCQEPVFRARKAMQEPGIDEITIKVDSAAARDNVYRSSRALGWQVQVTQKDDHFLLILKRNNVKQKNKVTR